MFCLKPLSLNIILGSMGRKPVGQTDEFNWCFTLYLLCLCILPWCPTCDPLHLLFSPQGPGTQFSVFWCLLNPVKTFFFFMSWLVPIFQCCPSPFSYIFFFLTFHSFTTAIQIYAVAGQVGFMHNRHIIEFLRCRDACPIPTLRN